MAKSAWSANCNLDLVSVSVGARRETRRAEGWHYLLHFPKAFGDAWGGCARKPVTIHPRRVPLGDKQPCPY